MAEFVNNEKDGGPQILECHSPLLNVLEQYPIVGRFEQNMFEAVLGTRVRREVSRNSGLYESAFYFSASLIRRNTREFQLNAAPSRQVAAPPANNRIYPFARD